MKAKSLNIINRLSSRQLEDKVFFVTKDLVFYFKSGLLFQLSVSFCFGGSLAHEPQLQATRCLGFEDTPFKWRRA
jgi:hypothetical protein